MRAVTLAGDLGKAYRRALELARTSDWPNPFWADKPLEFMRTILGVEPWGYQLEVVRNVVHFRHTAISGGRKVGKDWIAAAIALWWYACFADARAFLFGPTLKQIDKIIWREVKRLWHDHGRCVACKRAGTKTNPCPHSARLDGKLGVSSKSGLQSPDGMREIVGVTSVGEGGIVGFSGKILAIEDEAAWISDAVNTMIEGNLAGEGTRRLALSNPVRTRGWFFDLFHRNRGLFQNADGSSGLFQVSSETSPNVVERRTVYPGLASCEWIEEREQIWGRGSAPWMWHVEGKFLSAEAGQLFSVDLLTAAELKWDEDTEAGEEGVHQLEREQTGRLYLGVDVAGETLVNDETVVASRRGLRCLSLEARRGLDEQGHVDLALEQLARWSRAGDVGDDKCPVVVVDSDGETGWAVYQKFRAHLKLVTAGGQPAPFKVVPYHGSKPPYGQLRDQFRLNRDVLFSGLSHWFRDGGAIPQDLQLQAELVILRWVDFEGNRQTLVHKTRLREELGGKSTDRADALALSTWGARDKGLAVGVGVGTAPAPGPPYARGRMGPNPGPAAPARYLGESYGVSRRGTRR